MRAATGRAPARTGLLGNPSDGYGGRVLAMTIPELEATVEVEPAAEWDFADTELLRAAVVAVRQRRPALVAEPVRFSFATTIPRQVGLAGSSAIIIAALRALATRAGVEWDPVELARTALEAETDVLGWAAGPQDRIVQSYEGVLDMDFAEPWRAAAYRPLDHRLLPPLFVAWTGSRPAPSTVVHSDVRRRWLEGDAEVRATMHRFGQLAHEGRQAFDCGSAAERWPALLDEAYELRRRIWTITPADRALVDSGRSVGAGVAFAGSGGAVVGCVSDAERLVEARGVYEDHGGGFLVIHR